MGNRFSDAWEDITGVTRRLLKGTYYSPAAKIILLRDLAKTETFSEGDLVAIRRTREHKFYSTAITAAKKLTDREFIDLRDRRHARNPDSDSVYSSQQTNDLDSSTAKNRKRKMEDIAVGGRKKPKEAEIAHLIPHNYNCANLFSPLVAAMTGVPQDLFDKQENTKLEALVHGILEKKGKEYERVHNTGVKHNRANMVSVIAQKIYFDTWPKLLILPIMTLDQVLEYNGGPYEALVLAESPEVYVACGMQTILATAKFEEIDTAFGTLRQFVKASAYCTMTAEKGLIDALNRREKKNLKNGIQSVNDCGLRVPALAITAETMTADIKVMKMKFDMQDDDAHQECDVFALFLKAVAVESSMQGQKILPGCDALHECDICLDQELIQCQCAMYDPEDVIPSEIVVSHAIVHN